MTAPEQSWDVALRPKTLDSAGLAPTTDLDALRQAWADPAHKQVWLFSGSPGTGKTTCARALANQVRAEWRVVCKDEKEEIVVQEINCSDNTGVEFARALVSDGQLRSARPMVYILDECHQLTKAAQNALLKLLEEPPRNRYYFLCTTEPEKLVDAVRRRCKQIQFGPLTKGNAIQWMNRVAKYLNRPVPEQDVVVKLWETADGAPRNILQALQHWYATGKVESQLERVGDLDVRELARCIMRGEKFSIGPAKLLKEANYEPDAARNALCGYFTSVLLGSDGGTAMRKALGAVQAFARPVVGFGPGARGSFICMVAEAWQVYKESQ